MSIHIDDKQVFTLLEVSKSIQKTITERYQRAYWIRAEMNKLNFYTHSGHCYPELMEKQDGKIIAQIKSTLWNTDYQRINQKFLTVLQEPLKDGIKILFLASITFDAVYGLSLRIIDIDPSYTLGDLEKEKQECIHKLKEEGIFGLNKQKSMPLLPQRLAIISVETSKGYADFRKVIDENHWNYKFFHLLFPSLLQGEKAVDSILNQLKRIQKVINHFDVVVIIRGGGGDIGLSCYNSYNLAKEIAQFPIPVITGIGHATNETVVEMISHTNAITPTKIAETLLQLFHNVSIPVQKARERIIERSGQLLINEKVKFHTEGKLFRSMTKTMLLKKHNELNEQANALVQQSRFRFRNEKSSLNDRKEEIKRKIEIQCRIETQKLTQFSMIIRKDIHSQINQTQRELKQIKLRFMERSLQFLNQKKQLTTNLEKNIEYLNPQNILKRGFSITLLNGKAVRSIHDVKKGNKLQTLGADGTITANVESMQIQNSNEQ